MCECSNTLRSHALRESCNRECRYLLTCQQLMKAVTVFAWAALAFGQTDVAPMAHWRFDERSGTIAMDSANPGVYKKNVNTDQYYPDYGKYPGNILGAQWAEGQMDGGLEFDGSGDSVTRPSIPIPPAALTISAWVTPPA